MTLVGRTSTPADPGGFITVGRPPVAFWIAALSARVFG